MKKKEEKIIDSLPCDYHYKNNIIKFMKYSNCNLSTTLDFIFDCFFSKLNDEIIHKKVPGSGFSLKHYLRKLF